MHIWSKKNILLFFMILSLTVSSCSFMNRASPKQVAKEWMESGLNQDMDTFMRLTCSNDRDLVTETGFYMFLLGSAARFLGIEIDIKADLSDLEFKTLKQDKKTATVSVNGTLFVKVGQMPIEVPFKGKVLYLVKEDGKWRVCYRKSMR